MQSALKSESQQLKQTIAHKSATLEASALALEVQAAKLPNDTSPETPIGECACAACVCVPCHALSVGRGQVPRAPLS